MTGRFFFDQDNSCHWFLIPLDNAEEWSEWVNLPDDDERGWDPPGFAQRINGHPSMWTFTDPRTEE